MSGALDEDTARTLASGRETVGGILSSAQSHLKRIFIVFVIFFLAGFYTLREFIWPRLEQDLVYARMEPGTRVYEGTEIVVTDPFNVILMQAKIGIIVGILGALPVLIWYSRDALKRRGFWPDSTVPRWKKVAFVTAILALFVGGVAYAYLLFFPIMFDFLATNAINAGFQATWSLVMWTEFVFFLGLSFGLAAQLPLAMSAAARTGIVSYETFRDKWRYAVVGIFAFGAMFSPPDPFTQVMWGVPLVALYFVSLGVTKLAVTSKRASESVTMREVGETHWNKIAGISFLAGAAIYFYMLEGGAQATNDLLVEIGSDYRLAAGEQLSVLGLSPTVVTLVVAAIVAGIVAVELLFYFRIVELERKAEEAKRKAQGESTPGEPAEIDIGAMSAGAIRATSPEAFFELSEERALAYAEEALEADNPQKAKAIFDKFDDAQEKKAEQEEAEDGESAEEEEGGLVSSTAAGMLDPFTEDETTEDDIGGYYYDIRFILDSLTSKTIWIVATFMVVLAGTFMALYLGGIRHVVEAFFSGMPGETASEVEIVVLHPVEALIFMLKFSTVLAFLSIVPIVLYFAWPAIEQRGLTTGNREVFLLWGGTMLVALTIGTLVGFLYLAPTIFSILALDVVNNYMVIAYRISSFGWLVIYLTVGIGILAMIPATMVLFHHGRIIGRQRMRKSWRGVVLGFFALAAFFSPASIFTMFLVAIPAGLAYGLGLGLLWVYDLVGNRTPTRTGETAD